VRWQKPSIGGHKTGLRFANSVTGHGVAVGERAVRDYAAGMASKLYPEDAGGRLVYTDFQNPPLQHAAPSPRQTFMNAVMARELPIVQHGGNVPFVPKADSCTAAINARFRTGIA
jgi:hypothetical protein